METPEKFKNLAEAVRNEVYGKDVREAIATSIEKTGASSETAIKITEQLIDGSFDEAELTTEIERRLNELEEEYAPELNNVKSQLAHVSDEIGDKSSLPEWLQKSIRETTEMHDNDLRQRGINVCQPPYNAKGDGASDDTQAIQSALDSLEGGGAIVIPHDKKIAITGLTINHDNISIIGGGSSTVLKQLPSTEKRIIESKANNTIIKDMTIEGDWDSDVSGADGIYSEQVLMVSNVFLREINGVGIYNADGRTILNQINIYSTLSHGIHVGSDNVISGINIGRSGHHAISLGGGHNSLSGLMIWMSGRSKTTNLEANGINLGGRGNTIQSFTVIASASHGLSVRGRNHNINGTTSSNGTGSNFDDEVAGIYTSNMQYSTINVSAPNTVDKPETGDSSWGWQKYGIHVDNLGATVGNIVNVVTSDVDVPIKVDSREYPINHLRNQNTVNINFESSLEFSDGYTFEELPSPSSFWRGQQILVLGGEGETDQLYVCGKSTTTEGVFNWRKITYTNE